MRSAHLAWASFTPPKRSPKAAPDLVVAPFMAPETLAAVHYQTSTDLARQQRLGTFTRFT